MNLKEKLTESKNKGGILVYQLTDKDIESLELASKLMLKAVKKMIKNKEFTDLGLYLEGTSYELMDIVEKYKVNSQ